MSKKINSKITVPKDVYEGLELIKNHRAIKMIDSVATIHHANRIGLNKVAEWIKANPRDYSIGSVNGFESL